VKRCQNCGREGRRGFTKVGRGFALRGRTRTAQRLNMQSGPVIWECAKGQGCKAADEQARVYFEVVKHRKPESDYELREFIDLYSISYGRWLAARAQVKP
jgi:hypothetical protein